MPKTSAPSSSTKRTGFISISAAGLLESIYEAVLTRVLATRGLSIERQKPVSFVYQRYPV